MSRFTRAASIGSYYVKKNSGESGPRGDFFGRSAARSAPAPAGGASVARAGHPDDSGLFAASAGSQRAELRHLAGAAAAGVAPAGDHHGGRSQSLSASGIHRGIQPAFCGWGGATGQRFFTAPGSGSGAHLCPAARAGGKSGQHRGDRPSGAADRKGTMAKHSGRLPGDRLRTSRRYAQRGLWTTPGGSFRCRRNSAGATNQAAKSGGKDGGYATLENAARFPLFHRSGDDGVSLLTWKADTSRATKTGHLHVLTTAATDSRYGHPLRTAATDSPVSVAHDMSGLINTRYVRFLRSGQGRRCMPGDRHELQAIETH